MERLVFIDVVVVLKQLRGYTELFGAWKRVEEHCSVSVAIKNVYYSQEFRKS